MVPGIGSPRVSAAPSDPSHSSSPGECVFVFVCRTSPASLVSQSFLLSTCYFCRSFSAHYVAASAAVSWSQTQSS